MPTDELKRAVLWVYSLFKLVSRDSEIARMWDTGSVVHDLSFLCQSFFSKKHN